MHLLKYFTTLPTNHIFNFVDLDASIGYIMVHRLTAHHKSFVLIFKLFEIQNKNLKYKTEKFALIAK